jgi:hypothetical protein
VEPCALTAQQLEHLGRAHRAVDRDPEGIGDRVAHRKNDADDPWS